MTNIINSSPFLRSTRLFPEDNMHMLALECDRAYVGVANAVNSRTIGLFPTGKQAITGETWFFSDLRRQQTLRQVFSFTTLAAIDHNIINLSPGQITNTFGTWADNANSYGLIFAHSAGIPNQVTYYITSSQIVFVGAAPGLVSGFVILSWLSQP